MPDVLRAASDARGFTIKDGLAFHEFWETTPLDLSLDGRFLAYTTHNYRQQFNNNAKRGKNHVPRRIVGCTAQVLDIEQGKARALTETGTSWGGRWSPDGQRLAFFSDHTGEAHLCIWHRDTDQLQIFSEAVVYVGFNFETVRWLPDSSRVFFKALPVQQHQSSPPSSSPTEPEGSDYVQLWESQAARNRRDPEAGRISAPARGASAFDGLTDLAMADPGTGAVHRIQSGSSIRSFEVSPDGRQLAVIGNVRFEDMSRIEPIFDLYLIPIPSEPLLSSLDVQTPEHPPLSTGLPLGFGVSIAWSPDSTHLAYTTGDTDSTEKQDVVVVDVRSGTSRSLTQETENSPDERPHRIEVAGSPLPGFNNDFDPPLWTPDSRHLLCVGEVGSGGSPWMVAHLKNLQQTSICQSK